MTPGYITLDRLHEITRDVTGWRAAHPHLTQVDMSEPKTAEVQTVNEPPTIVLNHGTSSTTTYMAPVTPPHRGYRGSHVMTEESRIWWAMLGAGLGFIGVSILSVIVISVLVF